MALNRVFWIILCCLTYPEFAVAQSSLYQIDLMIFSHQQSTNDIMSMGGEHTLPEVKNATPLLDVNSSKAQAYTKLPSSASALNREAKILSRKPQYHVLLHYTWLQDPHHQAPILISEPSVDGWKIDGTVQVKQGTYYTLDTHLLLSALNHRATFRLKYTQRMKNNAVYYLDHARFGMLVKVHKINPSRLAS